MAIVSVILYLYVLFPEDGLDIIFNGNIKT